MQSNSLQSNLKLKLIFPSFKNIFLIYLISTHSNIQRACFCQNKASTLIPVGICWKNICLSFHISLRINEQYWGEYFYIFTVPFTHSFHWNKNRSVWQGNLIYIRLIYIHQTPGVGMRHSIGRLTARQALI